MDNTVYVHRLLSDILYLCKAAHINHPAVNETIAYLTKSQSFILNFILDMIKEHFDLTQEELESDSKDTVFVQARRAYYCLAKTETTASLAVIGSMVKKDHATVLHSIKKMHEELNPTKDIEWTKFKDIENKFHKEFNKIPG